MPRSPTVPVTTTSGERSDGTYSTVRPHGRAQALRHEGRLRRDHGDRHQTPARTSPFYVSSALLRGCKHSAGFVAIMTTSHPASTRSGTAVDQSPASVLPTNA